VKKDTASCDIVHGSRRSEINGETIMRSSTVGNKDSEETFVRCSTVVKKDTASCDIVHGSRRSEINGETIMRRSTVVKTDNSAIFDVGSTKEQGFQHVYKSIWRSLACGKNYYLNSHLDDVFLYSLTTNASEFGLQEDVDKYRMDTKVCNYFTFAEQGIAVALRPGDMLIFNPRYHHCLSSRTDSYRCKDVFCLSLYLKTAIVGGNDNSQP
jgi:hypothetical protein